MKMPTLINLHESGLRRSLQLNAQNPIHTSAKNADSATKAGSKAHIIYGTRAKKSILELFTIISLVNKVTLPSHQGSPNETYTEQIVRCFKELNGHYENTVHHTSASKMNRF